MRRCGKRSRPRTSNAAFIVLLGAAFSPPAMVLEAMAGARV